MTVIDLIIKLQSMPPNIEVMLDVSPDNGSVFKFVSFEEVEELDEPKCVLLTPGIVGLNDSEDTGFSSN